MKQFRIHKDDKVKVIAGKDKDKIGKVLKVLRKSDRVLVEKVNMVKRNVRPNPYKREPGGKGNAHPRVQPHGGVPGLRQAHPRRLPVRGKRAERAKEEGPRPLLQALQQTPVEGERR